MTQTATITFETISKGELTVTVDALKAPILVNALLRARPAWDVVSMKITKGSEEDE